MKNKIIMVIIIMLFITTAILPAYGIKNFDETNLEEQYLANEIEIDPITYDAVDWWPMFQHGPENAGYSTSAAPDTNNVLWTFKDKNEYSMYASAVIVDGKVFTASVGVNVPFPQLTKKDNCNGKVYCLDAKTGEVIWEHISRYGLHATPAIAEGKVYACSGLWYYKNDSVEYNYKGDAFCLDAEDGSLIWNYLDCGYVEGGPVIVDGKMYFASTIWESDNGKVYCLDTETGEKIWDCTIISPRGPVAVSDGKVYVGLTMGGSGASTEKLLCLNASNGETIWSWDEDDREEVIAAPTVVDGKLYVATAGYSYGTPGGTEHVNGAVHCLDAENGDLLWESDVDDSFYWGSPAVAYGNVYVGSSGTVGVGINTSLFGTFYCLNATDGSLVWMRSGLFWIRSFLFAIFAGCYSPAVADGKVYFGSSGLFSGNIHCLDAFTGKTIWTYKKFGIWGSFFPPAVADGKVYAGFESLFSPYAKLFCFGEEKQG